MTLRPPFMHAPGCSCDVCNVAPHSGMWKFVLATSLRKQADTQRAVGDSEQRRSGGLRLPSWIFPSTKAERRTTMKDVEKGAIAVERIKESSAETGKLELEAILEGRTKSPVSLEDLKAYLRVARDREMLGELAALDFLMAFNRYKAAFFALPTSQQAPDPYSVIEQLSSVGIDARPPVPPKDPQFSPVIFTTPRGRGRSFEPVESFFPAPPPRAVLPDTVISPSGGANSTTDNGRKQSRESDALPLLILDPSLQPLRSELQTIVDSYLSGISSTLLMTIVPPDLISLALSETELTTHPSTLLPLSNSLTAHFDSKVLPFFFRNAVVNLSRTTSQGRLLMAVLIFVIAMGLSATFIVLKGVFPRWSRLALTPLYMASVGYAIGSQTGLCFWLAWRGTREAKQYEEQEKAVVDVEYLRASIASDSAESTFSDDRSHENAKSHHTCQSIYTINAASLAEKGWTGPKVRAVRPVMTSRKERLIRMTGTATSTVPVEDAYVRKAQIKIAIQVTLLLVVSTAAIMTVVIAIP